MQVQFDRCSGRHPAAVASAPPAIHCLNLDVKQGEQVAIIGPSGAGKTSLLQLLACAMRPSEGTLKLDGVNPWQLSAKDLKALRGRLFLAPQVPPLPPRQRVVTSVSAGLLPKMSLWSSLRNLLYPATINQANAALALFDLQEKLFERVDRLSGGERQRVGLARALISGAELLLVDEPLSALDPARAELAMQNLTGKAKELGATLVCTLHQVDAALKFFPRIVGMRDGELAFDLPADEVSEQKLKALYSHHPEELYGPAPVPDLPVDKKPVTPMTCR